MTHTDESLTQDPRGMLPPGRPLDGLSGASPTRATAANAAGGGPPPLDLDVEPSLASGRSARYTATVVNRGSSEVEALLSVAAVDGRVRCLVAPERMTLAPGQSRRAAILLRPRRPRLLGPERQHTARIHVRSDAGGEGVARELIFVQLRAVSLWVFAVVALLCATAALVVTLLPERTTVPAVEGAADVATAQRALRAAGLRVDSDLRSRTIVGATPGTILDQIPNPGTRVDRGESVVLLVAIGTRRVVTPALDGQPIARAAELLAGAGLGTGIVLPESAPAASIVRSQLPAAGSRVAEGTAITLFVRPAPAGAAPGRGTGAGIENAPASAATPGRRVTVPAIENRDVAEYARAISGAGLVPRIVRMVRPGPVGELVDVLPPPGRSLPAGERVRVRVSAGSPQLAYDDGDVVRVLAPASGRTLREAAPPEGKAVEPSWSADGTQLLYRVGTRLLLVPAGRPQGGRVVYEGATKYAAATFAPAPASSVVALVRRTGDDGDLCFALLGDGMLRPRCTADKRWDLGRQVSWRPGGRELLVFGVLRSNRRQFGILRYRSRRPFSTNPRDWHGVPTTSRSAGHGAIAAAYSPSGERVALVTNIGLDRFQVFVTRARDLRDLSLNPLPVRGCEVAWRPDGEELAVVQSDDRCARPVGDVVRFALGSPRESVTVASDGRHPAYQPLTYEGPKGTP